MNDQVWLVQFSATSLACCCPFQHGKITTLLLSTVLRTLEAAQCLLASSIGVARRSIQWRQKKRHKVTTIQSKAVVFLVYQKVQKITNPAITHLSRTGQESQRPALLICEGIMRGSQRRVGLTRLSTPTGLVGE